jgi:hypothetical protein
VAVGGDDCRARGASGFGDVTRDPALPISSTLHERLDREGRSVRQALER